MLLSGLFNQKPWSLLAAKWAIIPRSYVLRLVVDELNWIPYPNSFLTSVGRLYSAGRMGLSCFFPPTLASNQLVSLGGVHGTEARLQGFERGDIGDNVKTVGVGNML